jgi:hypothetical protein
LANALGTMSNENKNLLTLSLTGNRIGDNGAEHLATVESLDMCLSSVSERVTFTIKALRYNRTLICLNLSSNLITDRGACALARVIN